MNRPGILLPIAAAFALSALACGSDDGPEPEPDCAVEECFCASEADCPEGWACEGIICVLGGDTGADAPDTNADAEPDVAFDIIGDGLDDSFILPGACTGDSDFEVLTSDPEASDECLISCASADDPFACSRSCLVGLGLSEECAECRVEFVTCLVDECPSCLGTPDEECWECGAAAEVCHSAYTDCAGDRPIIDPPDPPLEPGCTDDDRAALDDADWFARGVGCEEACIESDSSICVRECLAGDLGTSQECALCFAGQLSCASVQCEAECEDPEAEDCNVCRAGACIEGLEECAEMDLLEEPEQPFSRLRLLHLVPGLVSLSGYMTESETQFATNIAFGTASDVTDPIAVFGNQLDVRRASDGPDGEVLFSATSEESFTIDEVTTMVVYGAGEDGDSWLVTRPVTASGTGARWQVFNAALNVGEVDVYQTRGGTRQDLALDLGFGESSAIDEVTPAPYFIQFDADGDEEIDYEFGIGPLEAGSDVALFLFDDGGSAVYLMAVFADGQTIRYNPRT